MAEVPGPEELAIEQVSKPEKPTMAEVITQRLEVSGPLLPLEAHLFDQWPFLRLFESYVLPTGLCKPGISLESAQYGLTAAALRPPFFRIISGEEVDFFLLSLPANVYGLQGLLGGARNYVDLQYVEQIRLKSNGAEIPLKDIIAYIFKDYTYPSYRDVYDPVLKTRYIESYLRYQALAFLIARLSSHLKKYPRVVEYFNKYENLFRYKFDDPKPEVLRGKNHRGKVVVTYPEFVRRNGL